MRPDGRWSGIIDYVFGWFQRILYRPKIVDPTFGIMRFKGTLWTGRASLPGLAEQVVVDVFAGQDGPTENQRRIFAELQKRFEELRMAMERPLFDEYQSIRATEEPHVDPSIPGAVEDFAVDFPKLNSASEVWNIATLYRVEVYDKHYVDFCFDHEIRWADDHQLNVMVKDFVVQEVAYEG